MQHKILDINRGLQTLVYICMCPRCASLPDCRAGTVQTDELHDHRKWSCFHGNRSSSSSSGVCSCKQHEDPRHCELQSSVCHPDVPPQRRPEVQLGKFGPGDAKTPCCAKTGTSEWTEENTFSFLQLIYFSNRSHFNSFQDFVCYALAFSQLLTLTEMSFIAVIRNVCMAFVDWVTGFQTHRYTQS